MIVLFCFISIELVFFFFTLISFSDNTTAGKISFEYCPLALISIFASGHGEKLMCDGIIDAAERKDEIVRGFLLSFLFLPFSFFLSFLSLKFTTTLLLLSHRRWTVFLD